VGGKPDVLAGKTCVVLGLGDIGTEVARRAKAFGMEVLGIRRRPVTLRVSGDASATDLSAGAEPPPAPAGQRRPSLPRFVDEVVDQSGMPAALARADYLVVALPLTEATHHIVDAEALTVMKPTAYVFNIGRGALIDEPALIRALEEGRLAGAGLDVFEKEPLPEENPLYRMENVIVTPHSAGRSPGNGQKLLSLFCRNLRRYLARKPLLNLVDKDAGY
jgi:phosphoglycerate dehydrogenase-like enzyme